MKPIIAKLIPNAGPDESIVLAGTFTGLKHFVVYQAGLTKPVKVFPVKHNQYAATITLPATLKRDVCFIYAASDAGHSDPVLLNKAEVWWAQQRIVPGETGKIFGNNLAFRDAQGTSTSYVWLKPATGNAIKCPVIEADPYRVVYTVPLNVQPGQTYTPVVHNGGGGQYGFSEGPTVTGDKPFQWTGPTIAFDNGTGTDSEKFAQAWAKAKNSSNATIQLPGGRAIEILDDVELPGGGNIRVLGSSSTKATIRAKAGYASGRMLIPVFGLKRCVFENIIFDGAELVTGDGLTFRNCDTVVFNNCELNFINGKPFDINDSKNIYFNRCTITGQQSFIGKATQVFFEGNTFRMTNDCDMALHSFGGKGISLYKNICQDLEGKDVTSGKTWGKGRFFTGSGSWGKNGDFYAGYNTTINLGVRSQGTDPNSGEQYLWELGICLGAGKPFNFSADGLTFSLPDVRSMNGAFAKITKGTGMGQWRHVAAFTVGKPGTITITEPWEVQPDSTSYITVLHGVYHCALDGNVSQSKANAADANFVTANSGVQFYGGATDCIVDGHVNNATRYGICHFTTKHDYAGNPGYEPNFWIQYLNCKMVNNYYSFRMVYEKISTGEAAGSAASFGMVVRGCSSTGVKGKHVHSQGNINDAGAVQFSVWEHNTGFDPKAGEVGSGFENALYYKNK